MGVATMTYVAVACSSSTTTGAVDAGNGDVREDFPVANLVARPDSSTFDVVDDFPVANLVARPDSSNGRDVIDDFPVANLVARPDSGD